MSGFTNRITPANKDTSGSQPIRRKHDVATRSRFVWHCAKTGRPLNGHLVHLYLPGGQRIRGYSDGSNILFVEAAYDTSMPTTTRLSLAPEKAKWARNALLDSSLIEAMSGKPLTLETMRIVAEAPMVIDILMVVGNQMVCGLESRAEITADTETYNEVMQSIKLVLDNEFNEADRFETLHTSHRTLKNSQTSQLRNER